MKFVMKLIIDAYVDVWQYFWQQQLIYIPEEHSFYMDNTIDKIDIELIVNMVSLAVSDNIVVNVSGFCGLSKSMKSNFRVPEYKKGCLRVEHNLKHGVAYSINDDINYEYLVYANVQSGWICIGNPEGEGNAVEFIDNCVAVVGDNNEFVSLWLKPKRLPDI